MSNDRHELNGTSPLLPIAANAALDAYFHEARAKLLDVAAILDRIGRGSNAATLAKDARLMKLRQALEVLREESEGRAERVQQMFSLEYDGKWERPKPRP